MILVRGKGIGMDKEEQMHMTYELLKKLTDGFSDKRILGKGTIGVVYKGEDQDGQEIAVKLLNSMQGVDDMKFCRECKTLANLKHPNIVQLVGFCNETEEVPVYHDGKQITALEMHRAVCFEYMQNGNLLKHLSDEFQGFGWHERYNIIKGICEGLRYLHMRPEGPEYHLDLKPENILLDKNMEPKISDFGLSALIVEESASVLGASGYIPPEFIKYQVISKEFDIFSLGVIILKIMTGHLGYNIIDDMDHAEVIKLVYNKWRERLLAVPGYKSLEAHCQQVKRCVEIAVKCLEEERQKRPTIGEIIRGLNEPETIVSVKGSMYTGENVSYMTIGDSIDNMGPMHMTFKFLKNITDDFSDNQILGRGTFGVVYKGKYKEGKEIAVKILNSMHGVDDKEFRREFNNLVKLDHRNIVKLVGFCNEEEEVPIVHNGKSVIALKIHRALCFECMHNGSLQKHITDEDIGFDWQKRYKIIKGICQGLKYLHTELENPVFHLDLKPDNILLDDNMEPKISDFGLSRLIGEENTKKTISPLGTWGYLPPEFIQLQIISKEFDIFSLGVIIIKIMIGPMGTSRICEMKPIESIEHVHNKWRKRLQGIPGYTSLEIDCQQVKKCIELALKCIDERKKRPTINYIVEQLIEIEKQKSDRAYWLEEVESSKCSSPEMITDSRRGKSPSWRMSSLLCTFPKSVPLNFLREITDDFSPERQLGHSVSGTVYKGTLQDGDDIAVKKLAVNSPVANEKAFHNEVVILMGIKHENIVNLVAYCHESSKKVVQHNGRYVIIDMVDTLLCYEYLPRGTLDKYISAETNALDWHKRFKIIKGICQGLHFLHKELDRPLVHMNILTNTIWLNDHFVPKIAEFGFSRLFGEEQTRMYTSNVMGQIGYMAPEYLYRGEISTKIDIYSLGMLVIVITTGEKNLPNTSDMSGRSFVDRVRQNWMQDDHIASKYPFLDQDGLRRVKTCIEIGFECVNLDRNKRPSVVEILKKLDERKEISYVSPELLDVYPTQLWFPFKRNKFISNALHLTNRTDNRVAVKLLTKSPKKYLAKMPLYAVVPPRSTYTLIVTTREQKNPLPDRDEFLSLESTIVLDGDLSFKNADLDSVAVEYGNFFKNAQAAGSTRKVHQLKLKVICNPPDEGTSCQVLNSEIEIISKKNFSKVLSIDVHPSEPWIMTSHHEGDIFIWDYQTQAMVDSFDFTEESVYSAKFLDRKKWLLSGDDDGSIYVYSFDTKRIVANFEAHNSRITSLDVHPSSPLLLSSSHDDDHLIKLWDWERGWECIQVFGGHRNIVTQVQFNSMDTNMFASASLDHTVKIWDISSPESKRTLCGQSGGVLCVHSYRTFIRQCLITGTWDGTANIWDMETERCVRTLTGHVNRIGCVYCHPEIPILITGSHDGTVRVWNATTYRLESIIGLNLGEVYAFGYIKRLSR